MIFITSSYNTTTKPKLQHQKKFNHENQGNENNDNTFNCSCNLLFTCLIQANPNLAI